MPVMLYICTPLVPGLTHIVFYLDRRRVGELDLTEPEVSSFLDLFKADDMVIVRSFDEVLDVLSR